MMRVAICAYGLALEHLFQLLRSIHLSLFATPDHDDPGPTGFLDHSPSPSPSLTNYPQTMPTIDYPPRNPKFPGCSLKQSKVVP